ncbi:MAG: hypothetical protein HC797_08025 [Anaerolineales bacterium]|nr:hypothetical protein [Anaerolineales bacterium]
MKTYGHFIHGKETPASTGESFPSYAPMTSDILGYAAKGTEADVEAAVTSARKGFCIGHHFRQQSGRGFC